MLIKYKRFGEIVDNQEDIIKGINDKNSMEDKNDMKAKKGIEDKNSIDDINSLEQILEHINEVEDEAEDEAIRQAKVSIAISIGEELIKNGGEVARVEDTLERILTFYKFGRPNVFVVSNGIFLTVDEGTRNTITCVRTIPNWSINLEKISLLNSLSRQICQGKCSVEEARKRLDEINNLKQHSNKTMIFAIAFAVVAFCYLFGGRIQEMVVAFVVGLILKCFLCIATKKGVSKFMFSLTGSIIVSVATVLIYQIWSGLYIDKIIIGSIMPLVPGVALTTSIRDFFSGDYLSGGIHLIEALLTAVCIATGVGVAIKAFTMLSLI